MGDFGGGVGDFCGGVGDFGGGVGDFEGRKGREMIDRSGFEGSVGEINGGLLSESESEQIGIGSRGAFLGA